MYRHILLNGDGVQAPISGTSTVYRHLFLNGDGVQVPISGTSTVYRHPFLNGDGVQAPISERRRCTRHLFLNGDSVHCILEGTVQAPFPVLRVPQIFICRQRSREVLCSEGGIMYVFSSGGTMIGEKHRGRN